MKHFAVVLRWSRFDREFAVFFHAIFGVVWGGGAPPATQQSFCEDNLRGGLGGRSPPSYPEGGGCLEELAAPEMKMQKNRKFPTAFFAGRVSI